MAAAEAAAEAAAGGGGAAVAHWSALLRGAEESEAALEAFAEGGRALLVAVEGSDPASLHLLRSVWPDAAVTRRLQGGEAVLAVRVPGSAPQAAFWRAELALTSLTELRLLSGAHGAEPLRARSLAPASLAHAMGRAQAEARRAGAASRARGAPTPRTLTLTLTLTLTCTLTLTLTVTLSLPLPPARAWARRGGCSSRSSSSTGSVSPGATSSCSRATRPST